MAAASSRSGFTSVLNIQSQPEPTPEPVSEPETINIETVGPAEEDHEDAIALTNLKCFSDQGGWPATSKKDKGSSGGGVGTKTVALWVLGVVIVVLIGFIIFLRSRGGNEDCKSAVDTAVKAAQTAQVAKINTAYTDGFNLAKAQCDKMIVEARNKLSEAGADGAMKALFDTVVQNNPIVMK